SSGLTHLRNSQDEPNRLRVGPMIVKRNFGLLRIQWEGERPVVGLEVRGLQNELLYEHTVRY
ncbi:MAG: hypothetical protein NZM41_00190, partial [Saprospiraceae bacterium]|nr:hypothetical protein [Saprospiraceae bacterium]